MPARYSPTQRLARLVDLSAFQRDILPLIQDIPLS
jgi:hypothetical protein